MLEDLPQALIYVIAGLIGAILGSFANVCIVRLPREKSVLWPPSHCPACGHRLSWWENVPLLSYIVLRARCRSCRRLISARYPVVEAICIVLSILLWLKLGHPLDYLLYFCLLVVPLVVISFIDLSHRVIPDVISIPGIFVGIGVRVVLEGSAGRYPQAALNSVAGALLGGAMLFLVAFAYERIKKREGLGGGDIKLIAMLGAFFGWRAAIFILFMSSVLGSIVGALLILVLRRDMKYAIPFGPFLALAGIIYLFFGRYLINWYVGLLG